MSHRYIMLQVLLPKTNSPGISRDPGGHELSLRAPGRGRRQRRQVSAGPQQPRPVPQELGINALRCSSEQIGARGSNLALTPSGMIKAINKLLKSLRYSSVAGNPFSPSNEFF